MIITHSIQNHTPGSNPNNEEKDIESGNRSTLKHNQVHNFQICYDVLCLFHCCCMINGTRNFQLKIIN